MGLDMYLYARTYVSGTDFGRDAEGNFTQTPNDKFSEIIQAAGVEMTDLSEDLPSLDLKLKVGYWRKANQIHNWFVNEVQGGEDECKPHYVSREQLDTLRSLCREVLADHSKAGELMPVSDGGFFFGSYEYDEWYFEQLEDTVKILDRILLNPKFEFGSYDFEYQSSW